MVKVNYYPLTAPCFRKETIRRENLFPSFFSRSGGPDIYKRRKLQETKSVSEELSEMCVVRTLLFHLQAEPRVNVFMFRGDGKSMTIKLPLVYAWFTCIVLGINSVNSMNPLNNLSLI